MFVILYLLNQFGNGKCILNIVYPSLYKSIFNSKNNIYAKYLYILDCFSKNVFVTLLEKSNNFEFVFSDNCSLISK